MSSYLEKPLYTYCMSVSALLKDVYAITAIRRIENKTYAPDQAEMKNQDKLLAKYKILLIAFLFEDLGQIYIQYIFYEQFNTEISWLAYVKSSIMILLSFKGLFRKYVLNYMYVNVMRKKLDYLKRIWNK